MDMVETAELVAKTVIESRVEFKHINLKYLLVYLKLVLGDEILKENGLGDYIPQRTNWKESKAKSLSCQINKNMDNWSISTEALMWEEERMLVALMIKCAVLALMDSTCYSFGGQLYKQVWGAGIGLRASACMAKIVMGWIDRMWAKVQVSWDLCAYMYFRYIDDLRIYLYPITKGWMWESSGWKYDDKIVDERSSIERTKDEIAKSLNAVSDFIQFTTEGEEDFNNHFLPTLDFQTKVLESGEIMFKFFSKPMANNITIQQGTGLSKNVVFSSLRQELVRRMVNCSIKLDWDERLEIVRDFVQLLINSGHKFSFIKSLTLQAITRFKYMIRRSKLDPGDKKFRPLYRARSFDYVKRKVSKMVEPMTWFRGGQIYDTFKNGWKAKINKKRNQISQTKYDHSSEKEIAATMFIPQSRSSLLIKYIEEEEKKIESDMDWRIKLIEQSGFPLGLAFIPKFPLIGGCPRGVECSLCENTGIKCSKKGVVYKASCLWCKYGTPADVICPNPEFLMLQDLAEGTRKPNNVDECQDIDDDIGCILTNCEEEKERHVGMNGMNKDTVGGEGNEAVAMNGMNNMRTEGGEGYDEISSGGQIISYIGETSRPWRERVREHYLNLKNGSTGSFIISHWLEKHTSCREPPEFKWEVVDAYSDALRRQLCEGLQIIEAGVLNKKMEFHNNLICRMRAATTRDEWSEKELQKEMDERKMYKMKIKKFISIMSNVSNVMKNNKKNKEAVVFNQLQCYRYNNLKQPTIFSVVKRKKEEMDSSTPISQRREPCVLDLGEESPIEREKSSTSNSTYSASEDVVPVEKNKAGVSNELDSMLVTPPKVLSPDTYDKKLALHSLVISKASNHKIPELHGEDVQQLDLDLEENPFSNKGGKIMPTSEVSAIFGPIRPETGEVAVQSVGMDGMNKTPMGEDVLKRSVAMDGMNKTPVRGGMNVQSDGMDGMNKPQHGGVSDQISIAMRKKKIVGRRLSESSDNVGGATKSWKILLGKGMSKKTLEGRACPGGQSPKRPPSPMDIDPTTSTPSNKRMKAKKVDTNQRLLTDVWAVKKNKE